MLRLLSRSAKGNGKNSVPCKVSGLWRGREAMVNLASKLADNRFQVVVICCMPMVDCKLNWRKLVFP